MSVTREQAEQVLEAIKERSLKVPEGVWLEPATTWAVGIYEQ